MGQGLMKYAAKPSGARQHSDEGRDTRQQP